MLVEDLELPLQVAGGRNLTAAGIDVVVVNHSHIQVRNWIGRSDSIDAAAASVRSTPAPSLCRRSSFGLWIKWLILSIITLDIYTFWVYPRLMRWQVEKNVFAKTG